MRRTVRPMRVRWGFVAIVLCGAWLAGAPTSASELPEPAPGEVCGDVWPTPEACCPTWYAQSEALWLTRSRANSLPISAIDTTGLGDLAPTLNARDLDFGYQPGIRLTVGTHLNACNRLELSYFGLHDFHAAREVTDPNNGLLSIYGLHNGPFLGGVTGFDWANFHRIEYDSQLHNAELNFRHRGWNAGGLETDLLLGFRYLGLNERFLFSSVEPGGGPDGIDAYGTSLNRSFNTLLGGQIGGELLYHVTERLGIAARANAGLFLNFAGQSSSFIQEMGAINRSDYAADRQTLAGLIQVGLTAQYRLGSRLTLRGGYDVLLISGLATAPEQFDLNSGYFGNSLNDRNSVVYHGPSAGLEFQW